MKIPVKYSWFNSLHFLMEDGSVVVLAEQDEYFITVKSCLFFIALCKDIYFPPQVSSCPKSAKTKNKTNK